MKNFPFCILIPGFVFSCLAMGCDSGGEFSRFSVDSPNRVAASLVTENFEEGAKVENRATGAASESTVRFATYNVAMNRKEKNELLKELESGNSAQAAKVAEVIQRTRPDVLLLNEFDYDESGKGIQIFCT